MFLMVDGYGVLLFVVWLSMEGGMFYFVCGFISKMFGIECGVIEFKLIFFSFFGKLFMLLKFIYYMQFLVQFIENYGIKVWLVNIGWLGFNYLNWDCVDILVSKVIINVVCDD